MARIPKPYTDLGKFIRNKIEKRKTTVQELADSMDISNSHIYHILRGERTLTDEIMVKLIANLQLNDEDILFMNMLRDISRESIKVDMRNLSGYQKISLVNFIGKLNKLDINDIKMIENILNKEKGDNIELNTRE